MLFTDLERNYESHFKSSFLEALSFSRDTGVAKRATKHFAIEAQSLCPDIDVSYVNPVGYFLSSDVWHLRRSQVFLTI